MKVTERVSIRVDAAQKAGIFPHNWNYIGYDEINYTYTPEGETLLAKFGELADAPYYVRVHHLLCTGNCHGFYKWGSTNAYLEDEQGNPIYDWTFIDLTFDTLLKHHCKPFVELGFMPQDLADPNVYDVGSDTWTHEEYRRTGWAVPPKDYQKWYDLVFALVAHCLERYGEDEVRSWYWELWNEPDLDYYWKGTIEDYLKLYDYTAAAVKAAFPDARVGGPGTTNPDRSRLSGQFLEAFCEHVIQGTNYYTGEKGTPIDFTSFHVKGGGYRADPKHRKQKPPSVKRIVQDVETGYQIINKYPELAKLECILSEIDPDGWAAGGAWDNANLNFRNTPYYASFVISAFDKVTQFALEKSWDLRLLSWAFMFVGERCFEGTRTFSTQGIDKAILNLFRIYAFMGNDALLCESSASKNPLDYADEHGMEEKSDVSALATLHADNRISILIYNHHDNWDLDGESTISLQVDHVPFSGEASLTHYRIDSDHSNAYSEWVRQGKPMYPSDAQYAAIKARDSLEMVEAPQQVAIRERSFTLEMSLPVHGISLVVISAPNA
ncbi:MAG: beta-xylosidase [Anaerolineaceae bacterium]|nr:beta-xylosidase [Anaerolineaceae bacterium]